MIQIEQVYFGSPINDPTPSQRPATQFHEQHGYEMMYDPHAGLLYVKKDEYKKIYPVTNIKEMKPKAIGGSTKRTKQSE